MNNMKNIIREELHSKKTDTMNKNDIYSLLKKKKSFLNPDRQINRYLQKLIREKKCEEIKNEQYLFKTTFSGNHDTFELLRSKIKRNSFQGRR